MKKALAILDRTVDRIAKLNWSRMKPMVIVEQYKYSTAGIETTWRTPGIGLGIGLGRVDLWMGWLHKAEA